MDSLASRLQNNAQLYHRLTQDLQQEHDISLAYEDVSTRRSAVSEKLKTLQLELDFLKKSAKKDYDNLHKARHFSVRSAAATLKGKKKALIAKEEAEYQQAFESEQRAKRQVDIVSAELASLTAQESKLKQQKDHLRNIKSQLNGLLDEVFAEPDGSEIREPQLRAELQNYIDQANLATRDLQRFRDTDHNLIQALRIITKTKDLIKVAINYVSFDLFTSQLVDDQQIIYIEACQRNTWECQRRLNLARGILPEIPYPATLDVVNDNHMLGLRFDGGYVDIAWKAKTQQGYNVLVTAEKNIQSAMQWVRHYLRYTEGAIERLSTAKETTQASLYNERRRIFDRAISSNYGSSNVTATAPSITDVGLEDVPPPVYEPPVSADNHQPQNPHIPDDILTNYQNHSNPYLDPSSLAVDSGRHLRTASQSSSISSFPAHPPPPPRPERQQVTVSSTIPTSNGNNAGQVGVNTAPINSNNPFRASFQPHS
ncbi:uncharacterized protein BX664DRAFT_272932 [Halteromyces radiatus]|uniref:uncharacterized protein n=1 Tax=Halteromyces radiatus TaxID=101107 RepID=UPI00221F3458|nr:uncharacterized protein BX664DRAFT_272932 [Halteromyces radiatus]KAI8099604.1 hypothetical protein BX664DRAFT_272932 [Halteromyces radiatus]